jgi:hypothetical protein
VHRSRVFNELHDHASTKRQRETARRLNEVDLGQSATSPQEVRKLLLLINATNLSQHDVGQWERGLAHIDACVQPSIEDR